MLNACSIKATAAAHFKRVDSKLAELVPAWWHIALPAELKPHVMSAQSHAA